MRFKRAQAAMEFLMTYGWAILVVLAAIGALAYFGILSPSRFLPNSFTLSGGFSAGEYKVTPDSGIQIRIQNNLGVDTTNVTVTLNQTQPSGGNQCNQANTTYTTTGLKNGEQSALMVFCGSNTYSTNEKFKADVSVEYIRAGESLPHKASGQITSSVEE